MFNQLLINVFLFLHDSFPCGHGTAYTLLRDIIVALEGSKWKMRTDFLTGPAVTG